jgi:hypothetical protein
MASIDTAWVLVVEDLRDQAELCADVCAEAGLSAMTASNGAQGVPNSSGCGVPAKAMAPA